jgi:hypothetical protein
LSRRGLAALAAVATLALAGAAASGFESAAARSPEAGEASAAAKRKPARHRCAKRARRRGATSRRRARRLACTRVKRLASPPSAPERLVPVGGPAPGPGAPPPGGDSPSPPPPAGLSRFVSVAAREWSLTLSRPVVGTGSVTIELRNVGEDPHNLVVSPNDGSHAPLAGWPETDPGGVLRQTVSLGTGRYFLFCSLEGHEAAGMSVTLRVE